MYILKLCTINCRVYILCLNLTIKALSYYYVIRVTYKPNGLGQYVSRLKNVLFMLIIMACHYNKHTYLLTYMQLMYISLGTHAGEKAIKLNNYAMGTCNRLKILT